MLEILRQRCPYGPCRGLADYCPTLATDGRKNRPEQGDLSGPLRSRLHVVERQEAPMAF